jgi:putative nucleotidyltransferase with HDIG domain
MPMIYTMGKDILQLVEGVEELTPLPPVAARVMLMAEDDRTSALGLAQVLSSDQALTAQLIRISNSAYYGFARRVSTVREAVMVLGFKQVRQMAIAASLMNTFKETYRAEAFDPDLFWGHSVAVAVTAETIAKMTRAAKPDDAFTAGILHDIGRLLLRRALPEEFDRAVRMATTTPSSLHAAEVRCTGYAHDQAGQALAEKWKFPGHLSEAIGRHHNSRLTPIADGLAGTVALADRYVLHHGLYCGYEVPGAVQGLPPDLVTVDEAVGCIERVLEKSFSFIEGASGRPETWYVRAVA